MVECLECGTHDNFDYGDGTAYCRICGTQSQDIREEVVELDVTAFENPRLEVARGLNQSKVKLGPDRIWTVEEAIQIILLIQTKNLISLGYPLSLKNTVANMWFKFLARISKIYIPEISAVPLTMNYELNICDTISLIYISLRMLSQPILISDIIKWTIDGTLPYINAIRLLPSYFKPISILLNVLHPAHKGGFLSVNELTHRIENVIDILDDVEVPLFTTLQIKFILSPVLTQYDLRNRDFELVFNGNLIRFNQILTYKNIDLAIAATLVTTLRMYFQFESISSEKCSWKSWLGNYLSTRFKYSMHSVTGLELPRFAHPSNRYLINLPHYTYLQTLHDLVPQYKAVIKLQNVHKELKNQFSKQLSAKKESFHFLQPSMLDFKNSIEMALSKEVRKRGRKRKHPIKQKHIVHELIVYPLDDSPDCLPLELDIIINDMSACFFVPFQTLLHEVQTIAAWFNE